MLESLQDVSVFLVLGNPNLDIVFQMQSGQYQVEGSSCVHGTAGCTLSIRAQYALGLCGKDTLLNQGWENISLTLFVCWWFLFVCWLLLLLFFNENVVEQNRYEMTCTLLQSYHSFYKPRTFILDEYMIQERSLFQMKTSVSCC